MEFKRVFGWFSDDMPNTTEAVVYASSCGVIKVGEHKRWNKKNKSYSVIKERICKKFTNRGKQRCEPDSWKGKYEYVELRGKSRPIHRLVAMAWVPNPEGKPQVNHKNGIRNDNNFLNLEWVTNKENAAHAKSFREFAKGSKVGTAVLSEREVAEIKKRLSNYSRGDAARIASDYKVSSSTIHAIRSGDSWAHV